MVSNGSFSQVLFYGQFHAEHRPCRRTMYRRFASLASDEGVIFLMKLMKIKIHKADLVSVCRMYVSFDDWLLLQISGATENHFNSFFFIHFSLNHSLLSHFTTWVLYFPANTNRYVRRLPAAPSSTALQMINNKNKIDENLCAAAAVLDKYVCMIS